METQNNNSQTDNNTQTEDMGGTTNLSLEQLKAEDGIYNPAEDNPDNLHDQGDLHEIQAGDDLDEPDTDAYESVTGDENLGIDDEDDDDTQEEDTTTDEDQQNKSPNDADGNGEPASPTELNS